MARKNRKKQSELDPDTSWQTYRRLLNYLRPWWLVMLAVLVGFALYAASQTAFANWMEQVVEAVQSGAPEQRISVALTVVGIFLIRGLGTFLGQYGLAYIARQIIHRMRTELFNKMLCLPSSYYQQQPEGQMLSRITYTTEQVTGAVTNALRVLIREGLTLIGLLGYLLYMNWKLTLIFFAVGPIIVITVAWASKRFRALGKQIQRSVGDITQVAGEALRGNEAVRVFGGHAQESERFAAISEYNRQQNMRVVLIKAINTPAVQLMLSIALGGLVYIAMTPDLLASMTTGEFIAFLTAAGMIARPMRQLTTVNSLIQKGIAAAQDLFELLDQAPEPDHGRQQLTPPLARIELENVHFSYPTADRPALNGVSLTLQSGQSTALVGHSGSGKSTLINLLARFHEPTQGGIRVNDQPVTDYTLASLRQQIALVSQQTVLFDGTIADNIAAGSTAEVSRERIEQVAQQAFVTEFSSTLPEGLDTLLGEGGIALSGGQRQRVAIARAMLKDAPLLLLDEATSALDTESERHIQQALARLMQGRTTLIVAHRLSTIQHADQIVVMDQGQIIEQGSHQQLLAAGGAYSRLQQPDTRTGDADD